MKEEETTLQRNNFVKSSSKTREDFLSFKSLVDAIITKLTPKTIERLNDNNDERGRDNTIEEQFG